MTFCVVGSGLCLCLWSRMRAFEKISAGFVWIGLLAEVEGVIVNLGDGMVNGPERD